MRALRRLRLERGSAVVEFPMLAVLLLMIALAIVQSAVLVHTRNSLTDAAVQGAHHGALLGNTAEDAAMRTEDLIDQRFGDAYRVTVTSGSDPGGRITVEVTATLPLVGMLGPGGALSVDGHAVAEESL